MDVHHEWSRFENLDYLPQPDQLRSLMEVLPRPTSEHGTKLVSTHGDIWEANVLKMPNGDVLLTDFEQSCVSAAATDLAHGRAGSGPQAKEFVEYYLCELLAREPTEAEVYDLMLDAHIASHVHFFILRPIFLEHMATSIPDRVAEMSQLIEHTRRFNQFAIALRKDTGVAKMVLDAGHVWSNERDSLVMDAIMTPVVGPGVVIVRDPWKAKIDPLLDTSDMQSFELTLQSHPGRAVICQESFTHTFPETFLDNFQRPSKTGRGNWLSLGDAACALQVSYGGGSVYKTGETFLGLHIGGGHPGPIQEGNCVVMGSWSQPEFILNWDDCTISPKQNDQLVLGHGPCNMFDLNGREMVIFVPRGSPQKLVFDALPRPR